MREIKFRAWDVGAEQMYNWDSIKYQFNEHLEHELVKVMQFTGLHDKNGKPIYEGDILRVCVTGEHVPNRDSGGGIIDYDYKEGFSQLGVVGFTRCSFDYKTVKTESGRQEEIHAPIDWIENYEVIGNRFENPELLDQTS